MNKYRAVPVQEEGQPQRDTKEFNEATDFTAAALVGHMAGTVAVDLEKEVNGAWVHVAHIPGRPKPLQPHSAPEFPDANPVKQVVQ